MAAGRKSSELKRSGRQTGKHERGKTGGSAWYRGDAVVEAYRRLDEAQTGIFDGGGAAVCDERHVVPCLQLREGGR